LISFGKYSWRMNKSSAKSFQIDHHSCKNLK